MFSITRDVVIRTNSANTTLTIDDNTDGKIEHYDSLGKLIVTKCGYSCYYEFGTTAYAKATKGKIVAKEGGEITVLYATAAAVAAKEDGGVIGDAYCVSTQPVEDASDLAGYTHFSNSKEGNVTFKYVDKDNNPLTSENIQNSGTIAINEALEVERLEDFKENNYWIGCAADSFAGGTGTEADPYQISTAEQLARLAYLVNGKENAEYRAKYYKLTSNIDLSGKCWIPISAYDRKDSTDKFFKGYFDGNKKTITGLNSVGLSISYVNTMLNETSPINADGEYVFGLFGTVTGVTIKDLTLDQVNISVGTGEDSIEGIYVGDSVGSLIGYAYTTSDSDTINIENVTVNGAISGYDCVGGIIGQIRSAGGGTHAVLGSITLKSCVTNIDVTAVRRASCFIGATNKYGTKLVTFDSCINTKKATSKGKNSDFVETEDESSNYYDAAILMVIQDCNPITEGNGGECVINLQNTGSIERNIGNIKDTTLYLFR